MYTCCCFIIAVLFKTRIYSVHVMMQLSGTGVLLHLKQLWTGSWNIRKLLNHIIALLYSPNLDLIPVRLRQPVVEYHKLYLKQQYNNAMTDTNGSSQDQEIASQLGNFVDSFPRLEQLQLNILLTYLISPEKYYETATKWALEYATKRENIPDADDDINIANAVTADDGNATGGSYAGFDEGNWSDDEEDGF